LSDAFDASIFDKVAASSEDDRLLVDEALEVDDPAPQREGLPAGFRMRHEKHYVDELLARNHAGRADTAPASRVHPRRIGHRLAEPKATPSMAMASADIGESLDAIGACLHLFRARTRPAAERAALDLIAAEVARATWLVQALSVLDEEAPVARCAVGLGSVVSRIARVLGAGQCGAAVAVEEGSSGLRARGDEPLLTVAVAGIVMALQAVVERVEDAAILVRLSAEGGDRVRIEVSQDVLRLPDAWRTRLVDPGWADRPGGRRIAVALAAAHRIAEWHDATLTLDDDGLDGCRVTLSLPRA
jgi:nitrogen-specific signal transduction histidine kinase